MIMASLYLKLGWPEYQEYQQYDDFDEHACYSPENECYFIEQDWLLKRDAEDNSASDATIEIYYKEKTIEISSIYVGLGSPSWDKKGKTDHHHHKVTFKIGCKEHTFDYWSGLLCYKGSTVMTDNDMIAAFEDFISECISADQSIDDFQSEFGYENVSECIRIYNACKESLEAWKNFFIDPYDLDNWLRDTYDL